MQEVPAKLAISWRLALLVAAIAAIIAGALMAEFAVRNEDDIGAGALVLYVEEPVFDSNGRAALKAMAARFASAFPGTRVEWRFASHSVDAPGALAQAIADAQPTIVVFGNDRFLADLEQLPTRPSYVVPSDFPSVYLDERYGRLRTSHRLALISWYADNQDKLLELLATACGPRRPVVVGFFDEDYLAARVDRQFLSAASRQGIEAQAVAYAGFADFSAKLRRSLKDARVNSVYISMGNAMYPHMREAAQMVQQAGVLGVYTRDDQVFAGGLMSSEAPGSEALDQMALYAYLAINGADASALPTAHATRYEIAVNVTAAKRIGCKLQYETLVEATQVIE